MAAEGGSEAGSSRTGHQGEGKDEFLPGFSTFEDYSKVKTVASCRVFA